MKTELLVNALPLLKTEIQLSPNEDGTFTIGILTDELQTVILQEKDEATFIATIQKDGGIGTANFAKPMILSKIWVSETLVKLLNRDLTVEQRRPK